MKPFRTLAREPAGTPTASAAESAELPESAETWLLAPVAVPDFSGFDLNGNKHTLSAKRGKPVSSTFGRHRRLAASGTSGISKKLMLVASEGLQLVAVNVDEVQTSEELIILESYRSLSFPILRSTPDLTAIYNILFRSLFDRRRDMNLPSTFLVDEKGVIVKIYQGPVSQAHMEQDARNIPQTSAERLVKALPFSGVIENYEFGRNYLSYGSVFFERGYLEQAEAFFQLALQDNPSGAEAYYGLGSVYLQQQKSAEARKSFERAVQLHPDYPGTLPKAWNNLGILAARDGRTEEAIEDFKQALKIDPDYIVALNNIGNAYRQGKRWENAKSVFRRSLELNPQDPEANYGLGMIFAQLDDTEHAYELLQKALAARPAYPEALNNLGVLYLRTRHRDDAERSFKESIRVAASFDQSYLNLARLYAMEGDTQKARAVLLELLKQRPGHPQAEEELSRLPQ